MTARVNDFDFFCCSTIIMSPFLQNRNVPLIRLPKGGRIGADRDEQGGVAKGGSAGACAEQASADCRCQQALAGELPAGEATVEAISGGGCRRAKHGSVGRPSRQHDGPWNPRWNLL